MEQTGVEIPDEAKPVVYLAGMDKDCRQKAFEIATALRKAGIFAEIDHMERSIKAQFKYADKIGAQYVAVIGGNELAEGKANVKCMATGESESVAFADMLAYFQKK
jgi:histidyl-tRNA synthetase